MFLEYNNCKILLNLESHLIGDGTEHKFQDYKERLKEVILYLLRNKDILLEYEVDYLLTNYQQLFGAINDEFVRGALTALQIRYTYEHKHRIELQDTTYSDLKNILDELDSEKEILAIIDDFRINIFEDINYYKLIKLQCILAKGINIINLLNQKNIKCNPYDLQFLKHNAACSIIIKQHDINNAKKCTNLSIKSRAKLVEYQDLVESAVQDLINCKFIEALTKITQIDTVFIAAENIKNSSTADKIMLGKWTHKYVK